MVTGGMCEVDRGGFSPGGGCRTGESGRKNSCGDSLSLVECAAVLRRHNTTPKYRRIPRSPSESFRPPSPFGKVIDGTKAPSYSKLPARHHSPADYPLHQVRGRYCRCHYSYLSTSLTLIKFNKLKRVLFLMSEHVFCSASEKAPFLFLRLFLFFYSLETAYKRIEIATAIC